jgi:hypothetical protein
MAWRKFNEAMKKTWGAKHSVGAAAGAGVTSFAALSSAGIFHGREFASHLLSGQPEQVMAAALAAGSVILAAGVHKLHSAEQTLNDIRNTLFMQQSVNSDEEARFACLEVENAQHRQTIEQLKSRGYEENDSPSLWRFMPRSAALTFRGVFNNETEESETPTGIRFRASAWAIETMLPRITIGTELSEWKLVFYIPNDQFESAALFAARKFMAVIEDLVNTVAPRRGVRTTLKNIRISIVHEMKLEHRFHSIHVYDQLTEEGAVHKVVTYYRPQTSRAPDYNNGKVTVHPGAADQEYWSKIATSYFFDGMQLSFAEFRQAVSEGKIPHAHGAIIESSDHFVIL